MPFSKQFQIPSFSIRMYVPDFWPSIQIVGIKSAYWSGLLSRDGYW
jgi:hypothetical protein